MIHFRYGCHPLSWISKICKLQRLTQLVVAICMFMQISLWLVEWLWKCWEFSIFSMAAVRHFDFLNLKILTFCALYSRNLHVSANSVEWLWRYCKLSTFNMMDVCHLEFLIGANCNFSCCLPSQSACSCKIFLRSVERLHSYCQLLISNIAAIRRLRFVVILRRTTCDVFFVVFISVQNLFQVGLVVLMISEFKNFCNLAGNCLFTPFWVVF